MMMNRDDQRRTAPTSSFWNVDDQRCTPLAVPQYEVNTPTRRLAEAIDKITSSGVSVYLLAILSTPCYKRKHPVLTVDEGSDVIYGGPGIMSILLPSIIQSIEKSATGIT